MNDWRPNLVEVFEHYGARVLGGSGAWVKAECPLLSHEDQNPSATLNEEAGKWHCWSCDNAGDGLDIIQANEKIASFKEALAWAMENFEGAERESQSVARRSPKRGSWTPPWKVG